MGYSKDSTCNTLIKKIKKNSKTTLIVSCVDVNKDYKKKREDLSGSLLAWHRLHFDSRIIAEHFFFIYIYDIYLKKGVQKWESDLKC